MTGEAIHPIGEPITIIFPTYYNFQPLSKYLYVPVLSLTKEAAFLQQADVTELPSWSQL